MKKAVILILLIVVALGIASSCYAEGQYFFVSTVPQRNVIIPMKSMRACIMFKRQWEALHIECGVKLPASKYRGDILCVTDQEYPTAATLSEELVRETEE